VKQKLHRLFTNPLVQNAAALYGVQAVRKTLPLILIPYLAWALGPSGWGMVAFMQSMAEFAVLVIEFGFNLSATREIAQNRGNPKALAEIMSGVLGAQLFLAAVGIVLICIVSQCVPSLRSDPKLVAAGLFYAVGQGLIPLWFFQGLERMRLSAVLEVSGRIVGLAAVFLFVHSPKDTWITLFIQGVAPALATVAGLIVAFRSIPFYIPTRALILAALLRGWPLFVFRSAESLYGVGNAFILGLFATPAEVGYFASAEKISRAIFGLLNPIRDALYPRLSHLTHHSPAGAARLARIGSAVMISGGVLLGAGTFVFSSKLIRIFMGEAFAPAIIVLKIFSLLPVLLSITHSAGIQWLLPRGRDAELNRIILLAGALNVVLAVSLAPYFAHLGMAWAVTCSEAFVCIGAVRATLRPKPSDWGSVPEASLELT
jgi:PST family polysaccharide transporter